MKSDRVTLAAILLGSFIGCTWGWGESEATDYALRGESARRVALEVERLRAYTDQIEDEDARSDVEWSLDRIEDRALDEAQRAEVGLVTTGYPPETTDPESPEADINFNVRAGRAHAVDTKRRVLREIPAKIARGVGNAAQGVAQGIWAMLPWWLKLGIIATILYGLVSTCLYVRARLHRAQLAAEIREKERRLAELSQQDMEKEAALAQTFGAVERAVPKKFRKILFTGPDLAREQARWQSEVRKLNAQWNANALGDGILTEDEKREFLDHLEAMGAEVREKRDSERNSQVTT